jgi:hypothetical protein
LHQLLGNNPGVQPQITEHGFAFSQAKLGKLAERGFQRLTDQRPVRVGIDLGGGLLADHAGQNQQVVELGMHRGVQGFGDLVELPPIVLQHLPVDLVLVLHPQAIHANRGRDRAPRNGVAGQFFDFAFQSRVSIGAANHQFEITIVNRADFHRDAQSFVLVSSMPKTGHA